MMARNTRSAAKVLVEQLRLHGVDTVFCVPGESYLAVLDALYDVPAIRLVTCRHENGASMMADAYGKLTGRPGICMATRGPGAANATAGLHVAMQDSTPMILFIGQVARDMRGREAFQEVDYVRMFGGTVKWVAEIEEARRVPEFLSRAFHVATSGRPGPVVLALPEDMLVEETDVADALPYRQVETWPGAAALAELGEALAAARRPFVILGGSAWDAPAVKAFADFAAANALPVGCAFRRQDRFDNVHPSYAGDIGIGINPKLAKRIKESDLLLVVGARLGEMTTSGYTLIEIPVPRQKLIHVYPDPDELGRVYRPSLGIVATPRAFAASLAALQPVVAPVWAKVTTEAHQDYRDYTNPPHMPGTVQMGEIIRWLDNNVPEDTIFANGAGNFATWLNRYHRYRQFGTLLGPTSGSMGYGVPAAIAAAVRHPERLVIGFTGDGDFLMTGQELATAIAQKLQLVIILLNNNMYGTIRMHQETHFPGRVIATDLANPDFAALTRAYGGHGEIVERTEDFAAAFARAKESGTVALLEVRIDPEAITPGRTLSQIRDSALED